MRIKFIPVLILFNLINAVHAQSEYPSSLNIGSPAPPLRISNWLKGEPIHILEKGKVYVIDLWATWCGYCILSMPHLSDLARKYENKISFIAINLQERKTKEQVKAFVDSMGRRMDFAVAREDSNFVGIDWFDRTGASYLPTSFVVDAEGRLAWIGLPTKLDEVLPLILKKKWHLEQALAERNLQMRIDSLDKNGFRNLIKYAGRGYAAEFFGSPDTALLLIKELIANDPELEFAPLIAQQTFIALLKIDNRKAYEYGIKLMKTKTPFYDAIVMSLDNYPYKYNTVRPEIFKLAAEAYVAKIKTAPFPLLVKTPENYFKIAEWYMLSNNKKKAKKAMRNAIKALKKKGNKEV